MHWRRKIRTVRSVYASQGIGGVSRAVSDRLTDVLTGVYSRLFSERFKGAHELAFWKHYTATEGNNNAWYRQWYTTHFGLSPDWYVGKRILDIGCGPLGSLEWADAALERVGLDPLAHQYKALGASRHKMRYAAAPSERIPFADGHFDVVASFNSLDHVADVSRTAREIVRVLRPGGLFLLITEVNHEPTPTEPQTFGWEIIDRFQPALELLEMREYEKAPDGVYQGIRPDNHFDHSRPTPRPGVLDAKFRKRSSS